MKKTLFFLVVLATLFATIVGCRPYNTPEYVNVNSNETAFVIPAYGNSSDQGKFMSEEFLRQNKVPAKKILLTKEWVQMGRQSFDGKWLPTILVIKVDRTPVSRVWAEEENKKNSSSLPPPMVESKESIGFTVGITLTGMIEEDDAAMFLYKYASKPLPEVIDSDVRNFIQGKLSAYFGELTLEKCKTEKQRIIDKTFAETKAFFKPLGINISQMGATEGFTYLSPAIQNNIDALAVKESETALAALELEKQKSVNKKNQELADSENAVAISKAKAKAEAAKIENQAMMVNLEAEKIKADIEVRKIYANAALELAKNPNQKLPNIVPENGYSVIGLDKLLPGANEK